MSSYETDPDVQLMLRFQRGDEGAFDELVRRHQQGVRTLTLRYVGDPAAADDLAQEVFLRVHHARASYQPLAKFTTWLHRIAANLCLNELRDREKFRPIPESVLSGDGGRGTAGEGNGAGLPDAGVADPPSSGLEREELRRAVAAAVHALPPNQRMAVILFRWQGCSYQEIAESLDVSVKAVKSLLSRAKENLAQSLARHVRAE
jgi:RNA polymerase sigma-70 factor (ECF subfamily)